MYSAGRPNEQKDGFNFPSNGIMYAFFDRVKEEYFTMRAGYDFTITFSSKLIYSWYACALHHQNVVCCLFILTNKK